MKKNHLLPIFFAIAGCIFIVTYRYAGVLLQTHTDQTYDTVSIYIFSGFSYIIFAIFFRVLLAFYRKSTHTGSICVLRGGLIASVLFAAVDVLDAFFGTLSLWMYPLFVIAGIFSLTCYLEGNDLPVLLY